MSDGNQPLSVSVGEDDALVIKIGVNILAFALQAQNDWPEDIYINNPLEFACGLCFQLEDEAEDGTTLVHKLFDTAASEFFEQGCIDGLEEGNVEKGIAIVSQLMGLPPIEVNP